MHMRLVLIGLATVRLWLCLTWQEVSVCCECQVETPTQKHHAVPHSPSFVLRIISRLFFSFCVSCSISIHLQHYWFSVSLNIRGCWECQASFLNHTFQVHLRKRCAFMCQYIRWWAAFLLLACTPAFCWWFYAWLSDLDVSCNGDLVTACKHQCIYTEISCSLSITVVS